MSPADLIRLAVIVSMALLVCALGLRAAPSDLTSLLRRPGLLLRSLLAMYVAMPLSIIALVAAFDLRPPVKLALVALALSPVPPFLPGNQLKLKVNEGYVYGLFVASALLAVVFAPFAMALLATRLLGVPHVAAGRILGIVSMTVLAPLVLGVLLRHLWPQRAARWKAIANVIGIVLLLIAVVPVLIALWPEIRALIGDGTLLAIVAFTLIGLVIGHLMGGPEPGDRSVLALATASRHPAVALAVATASFPQQTHAPAAVLLALLVGTLASAPYTNWRKRMQLAHS